MRDAVPSAASSADDFQDADPNGQLHNRARLWRRFPAVRKNILSELTPHVFGDSGYIRGLATLVDGQGKTVARVRFTVYVYRDRRWLAVAGRSPAAEAASSHARRGAAVPEPA